MSTAFQGAVEPVKISLGMIYQALHICVANLRGSNMRRRPIMLSVLPEGENVSMLRGLLVLYQWTFEGL